MNQRYLNYVQSPDLGKFLESYLLLPNILGPYQISCFWTGYIGKESKCHTRISLYRLHHVFILT